MRPRQGRGGEQFRIDAKLGNDRQRPLKALLPPDGRRLLAADQRVVSMSQHPALDQPEGEWIAPLEVLPGEEQRLCPDAARSPNREVGGEVVRLLVDVHDLRREFRDPPGQPRIIVQVEVPVEANRLDDQAVALGEGLL